MQPRTADGSPAPPEHGVAYEVGYRQGRRTVKTNPQLLTAVPSTDTEAALLGGLYAALAAWVEAGNQNSQGELFAFFQGYMHATQVPRERTFAATPPGSETAAGANVKPDATSNGGEPRP